MASRADYQRRRRNAFIAALVLAILFIIIVVLIIVAVAKKGGGGGTVTPKPYATATPTVKPVIPTLQPITDVTPTPDPGEPGDEPTPSPTPDPEGGEIMYVNTKSYPANMRATASSSADLVAKVERGAAVTVYGSPVNGFYKVKTADGKEGYISSSLLSKEKPGAPTATETPSATPNTDNPKTMYVSLGSDQSANVRKAPGGDQLSRVTKDGTKITVYEIKDKWAYVKLPTNEYGYIYASYLTEKDPTANPTPTPGPSSSPRPSGGPTATPTATPTPKPTAVSSLKELGLPAALANQFDAAYASQTKKGQEPERQSTGTQYFYELIKLDGSKYYIVFEKSDVGTYNTAAVVKTKPAD